MFALVTTVNGKTETANFRSDSLATDAYNAALAYGESPMFLGEAPVMVNVTEEADPVYFLG